MITFIKAKVKKSDGQTNIDKYRVAGDTILQNSISDRKVDLLRH